MNCEKNIDECASAPCSNNGICIDGVNSYTCQCSPPFTGTCHHVSIRAPSASSQAVEAVVMPRACCSPCWRALSKQVKTARWRRLPVPHIHVRRAECVVQLRTTPLTLVVVLLVGKVCAYLRELVCPMEFTRTCSMRTKSHTLKLHYVRG